MILSTTSPLAAGVHSEINVTAEPYNAICDGSADDTAALNKAAATGAHAVLLLPPGAVCKASGLTLGRYSTLRGYGAKLISADANRTVLIVPSGAPLQSANKLVIEGIEIDGASQPGTIGLGIGNAANVILRDVNIHNCETGLAMSGTQFGEFYAVRLYANHVGMKIYSDPRGGGGNSNSFYGLQAVNNTVGAIMRNLSPYPFGANYFYNPSFLNNSLAALAVFGTEGLQSTVYFYGGAPEANASGPASSQIIDGVVINRSAFYLNKATVMFLQTAIADARANPEVSANDGSVVVFNDSGGYGQPFGSLVSADATSQVKFEGTDGFIGQANNVTSWPKSIGQGISQTSLSGIPGYSFSKNAPAFVPEAGAVSGATVIDPIMGRVYQVTHAKAIGNQDNNRAQAPTLYSAPTNKYDIFVSVTVKSNVNCSYSVSFPGTTVSARADLIGGMWVRMVLYKSGVPPGTVYNLVGYANDRTGPTITFANLEVITGPSQTMITNAAVSQALETGAVSTASQLMR